MEKREETILALFFGTFTVACALVFMYQFGPKIIESSYGSMADKDTAWFIATIFIVCPATIGVALLTYAFGNIKKYA